MNFCCIWVSGPATTDHAAVFLCQMRTQAVCSFCRSEGVTGETGPAAICQPADEDQGCSLTGWGRLQLFQPLFTLEFGACVLHYLSFNFLWGTSHKTQRMQRWKRAVHIIIVLTFQRVPGYKLTLIYSTHSPGRLQIALVSATHFDARQNGRTSAVRQLPA